MAKLSWKHQLPMPASRMSDRQTLVIGHRGAAGLAPENTMAAFQKALDVGCDGIEFDVQRSADGHLVVAHDDEMDRTTNISGLLRDLDLAEIQAADSGSWFDPVFAGEKIPSLPELFRWLQGNDLLIFLELKDPFRFEGIEQQVIAMIHEYHLAERVQLRSFFHESLHICHDIDHSISISELWFHQFPSPSEMTYKTLNILFGLYTPERIAEAHARGQKCTAWTVNNMDVARDLIAWGIDGITSDYPDQVIALIES